MSNKTFGRSIAFGVILGAATTAYAVDYYVARNNATPAYPFTSWASASTNIQNAVNAAADNDTVWVAPGTYTWPTNGLAIEGTTNIVDIRKALTLKSSSGNAADTIIDGQGRYRGMYLYCNSGVPLQVVIDGFTFTDCRATNGAAIHMTRLNTGTNVVQNCVFKDNTAIDSGGGLYIGDQNSSTLHCVISNCLFQGNHATNSTGGAIATFMRFSSSSLIITDSVIVSNTAGFHGGGIHLYPPPTTCRVRNCVIKHNTANTRVTANGYGGAVYIGGDNPEFKNCLIHNNSAKVGGGFGMGKNVNNFVLENCTIFGNSGSYGSAIAASDAPNDMRLINTIIYNDTIDQFSKITKYETNCCFDPLITYFTDPNTFTNDPMFVDSDNGNFHLIGLASPCVDAGLYQPWMDNALDLDGTPRIDSGAVDVGCYELQVIRGTAVFIR